MKLSEILNNPLPENYKLYVDLTEVKKIRPSEDGFDIELYNDEVLSAPDQTLDKHPRASQSMMHYVFEDADDNDVELEVCITKTATVEEWYDGAALKRTQQHYQQTKGSDMTKEINREELAAKALEDGSYLVYKGETFRIDSCELQDGQVIVSDTESSEQHYITIEDFVLDTESKVLGLFPIYDNSLEEPSLVNLSICQSKIKELMECSAGLMEKINDIRIDAYDQGENRV